MLATKCAFVIMFPEQGACVSDLISACLVNPMIVELNPIRFMFRIAWLEPLR